VLYCLAHLNPAHATVLDSGQRSLSPALLGNLCYAKEE
jgi:hypothetical protein